MSFRSVNFKMPQPPSFLTNIMNNTGVRILGIVLLLVIIAIVMYYFVYKPYVEPATNPTYKANGGTTNDGSSNKHAELMMFSTDWCPHCQAAKPEWEELKSEYEGKTINGYVVTFTNVDCTNETPEVEDLMNKYKIQGYPTIKLLKDGQVIEYDAKPTKATMAQFLNTVL